MVTAVIASLEKGGLFSTLNLQDVYFHIMIHSLHREYLCFIIGQDHFQHQVFPFGLSSAPSVFSKGQTVVITELRHEAV